MATYLGVLKYRGTNYHGFEKQVGLKTIQGELERALKFLTGQDVQIHGAGRTDAGVHANGQAFSFSLNRIVEVDPFLHAFNRLLPKDILVRSLTEKNPSFNARRDNVGKKYSYRFKVGERDPFRMDEAQLEGAKIDLDALSDILSYFIGRHDFRNFTSKSFDPQNYVREIEAIDVIKDDDHYQVDFYGPGFMTYMVRIIMGVSLRVAMGRLDKDEVLQRLDDPIRKQFNFLAPAEGLTLEEVLYEN